VKDFLTVRECAEVLGVSVEYIRDRIRGEELRALRRVGRGYLLDLES
jgi:excisionase family DNA binding protein